MQSDMRLCCSHVILTYSKVCGCDLFQLEAYPIRQYNAMIHVKKYRKYLDSDTTLVISPAYVFQGRGVYSFVFPFVCLLVCSFFHLSNHSSENIHTWVMGTLESLLSFHKFWPQGSCLGVGKEVKVWDTLKKC